jgi:alpha/beta superfamily hydrolase
MDVKERTTVAVSASQHVIFASAGEAAPRLEGLLTTRSPVAAILCHPQPATSTMDDPLLLALEARLTGADISVLRFNFRGVAASEGESTDGRQEPLDVAGAVQFARSSAAVQAQRVVLIGHGFGAWMSLVYAAHDPALSAVVPISPPVIRLGSDSAGYAGPKFFVCGEYDEVCPPPKLETWVRTLAGECDFAIVPGVRYLMHGSEDAVAEWTLRYLQRAGPTPRA